MRTTTRIIATTLGLAGALAAGVAQAHTDVQVRIGLPLPLLVPAPVVVRSAPVYVRPAPVYYQPAPVYGGRPGYGYRHGGYGRDVRYEHPRGDRDHDGVPNRWDRRPNNPNWR